MVKVKLTVRNRTTQAITQTSSEEYLQYTDVTVTGNLSCPASGSSSVIIDGVAGWLVNGGVGRTFILQYPGKELLKINVYVPISGDSIVEVPVNGSKEHVGVNLTWEGYNSSSGFYHCICELLVGAPPLGKIVISDKQTTAWIVAPAAVLLTPVAVIAAPIGMGCVAAAGVVTGAVAAGSALKEATR